MGNKKLNALGKFEDLELFDSKGNKVYEFITKSNGGWYKYTYNSNGNQLTYENSDGVWRKSTYDSNNNVLTFENSNGDWYKRTYDSNNNVLTFEDSNGVNRGFDIPEFTKENLLELAKTAIQLGIDSPELFSNSKDRERIANWLVENTINDLANKKIK